MFGDVQATHEAQPAAEETTSHDTTITALDAVVARHADSKDPAAMAEVARALVSKAIVLSRLGRGAEELATYDEVIRRFMMSSEPEIVALVAMSQNRRGRALALAGRIDEALTAFDLGWAMATGWKDAHLERQAAAALYATGALRKRQGRTADALTAWGDMVRQFGASEDIEVAAKLVAGDEARVALLRQSERVNDAIRVCNDMIARLSTRAEPGFRAAIGQAGFTRAECLLAMNNPKAALEACEEVAEQLETSLENDPRLARWRAAIGVLRGRALRQMGRTKEAVAVLSAVDRNHRGASNPQVAEQVATALVELSEVLSDQAEFARSRAFSECVIRRYAGTESARLEPLVKLARDQLARTPGGGACESDNLQPADVLSAKPVESGLKIDTDFEMLRGNATFNAFIEQAQSA